jgi:PTH1 family peptidyl-tRNA hydrolase
MATNQQQPIQLIVGLGNPGAKYSTTRHNAGFWFVEEIARQAGVLFRLENKFYGEVCRVSIQHQNVWLLKPTTFMNSSGRSVAALARFYKIPVEAILVAHDELDLPVGTARWKFAGGHGGHNGLRDIMAHLSKDYWRLRLGVDHPGDRNKVVDYVLSNPSRDDSIAIDYAIDAANNSLALMLKGDSQRAMNQLHSQKTP